jgi:hypothetical protein
MTYQNYKHYKLPITMNPLDYGKLILKIDQLNLFILQLPKTNNILILTQKGLTNHIKLYKEGDFRFEYSDQKLSHNSFTRIINSTKFTFRDNKLVQSIVLTLILILFFLIFIIILNSESSSNIAMAGLANKNYRNIWKSIYFNINNQIFSIELLEGYFNKFWKIVSPKIEDGCHIYILLKFQFEDGNIHTIGKLIRIDHDNFKNFITQIINYMEGMGDYYNQSPFNKIIFSYGYSRGKISDTLTKSEVNLINFKDMKLPISVDPNDYGSIIETITLVDHKIYIIHDNLGRTILFKEFEKENIIIYNKSIKILEFKDIKFSEGKFLRILGNRKLFFENGSKVLDSLIYDTPFISKLKKDKIESNNFITLDIETYGEKELIPYLISFYDGSQSFSFYLSDYSSIESMMEACFKKLFIRKYNKQHVYIHNFTKFDIYFLLKYLVKYVHVNPLIHNGRFIQLSLKYGPDLQYEITFKDSFLILLASLEKLGKNFAVENQKSRFPHKFVSVNNLNYIGNVPSIDNFFKITEEDYNNYLNSFNSNLWDLKSEAIKYCQLDCISLYQILLKFNSLIFEQFSKNIHRYPTLPSLAFAIFRSSFMDEENIPKLTGNIAKNIKQGYTGGSTDMFIPHGKNIYCYDVNSLYPSVMINQDMPIGKPEKLTGDFNKIKERLFGFFYVQVNCPVDIKHPIIQIKHKTKNGIKTISPVGTWSMWIFSEEMYNAMDYGYTFTILEGYKFDRRVIFKKYVEFLYNLRQQYNKSHPLNLIAKILLNSLYGRFGMNEITLKYEIILKEDFLKFENKENIFDTIELEDYILIGIETEVVENESNISVGIAAAITAYARIHMTQFKNNQNINLFYTDTDSIYTDSELDEFFIDQKKLGKLKLEYFINEAVFLGPKSYCLQNEKGLVTKVKGLKDTSVLTLQDFKDLLNKDFYKDQTHAKWFKSLEQGNITIKEQLYRLKQTDNKRDNIYLNNTIVSTKPIIINE